ncbi:Sec1 domain containing protein 1 [Tritrichomonas musculus]|uniref:Sec1 domain containing protein 1 n=1 Tax=Tritrichomonas musculus TaxID=1915356 RepID=A0ABR2I601_9EUKA
MLREKQKKKILEILNCNSSPSKESGLEWKILIYDERGSSIISSIFEDFFSSPNDDSSKSMKNDTSYDFGVTYHAPISDTKNRTRISDVPAIYFILPTKENIEILINDIHRNLYDKFYINFISSIKKDDLREFARRLAQETDGSSIAKISDAYLDFLSYEEGRFELFENDQDSLFKSLYGRSQQLSDLQVFCDQITDKLLSILVTNSQGVPLILSKGDLSKVCSDMLTEKIQNLLPDEDEDSSLTLKVKKQPFGSASSSQRPILVLTDRTIDFLSMVYHCNTYDSLLNDLFGLKNDKNGLFIGGTQIDKSTDKFWIDNKHKPIDVVFTLVNGLFKSFKREYSTIDKNLTQAISNIQNIKLSQDSLTAHTKLCENVLSVIKDRRINEFYLSEVDIISKPSFNFVASGIDQDLIFPNGNKKDTLKDDKLRLLSVAYLADTITDSALVSEYGQLSDMRFLTNVGYYKTFRNRANSDQYDGGYGEDLFTNLVGRFNTYRGKGKNNEEKAINESMKILTHMPVSELARKAVSGSYDDFVINDALKNKNKSKSKSKRLNGMSSSNLNLNVNSSSQLLSDSLSSRMMNVIVFVVGGGNYSEFDGIYGVGVENQGKGVELTYGCTKMQRPTEFLHELMEL